MTHRHFSNPSTRSGIDPHDSNHTPVEQSYTPTGRAVAPGNGPFVGPSLTPVTPVGHVNCSNYNIPTTREPEPGPSHCTTGIGRPLKRKRPCESDGSSSFCSAGSSSSSSQMPAVYYRSISDDSLRNVRRRPTLELGPSMTRTHHYQSTTQVNYSAPVQPANLDATSGQWNCAPRYAASSHRRMSPPDINSSRQHVSSSQYVHGPYSPSMREGHGNGSRRVPSSYGNGPSYTHHAHGGTSSTNGNSSSRYSRHFSAGGWRGSYRSGRPRIDVERSQPVDVTEARAQTIMMVDRASFYSGSRNFLDEYRDLRLDIDSMSYEELLNLGERIGNVSTGLSEDSMSKCLKEKVYCSLDQNRPEISCPICLEEYENGDKVGTMEKCGHDYHVDCIKKWLLTKKVCPICKSECSNQQPMKG